MRRAAGISARSVARAAGLRSAAHVSFLEDHAADPRVSTAVNLSRTLGVALEWLCTGEGSAFAAVPALDPTLRANRHEVAELVRAAVEAARAARAANDNARSTPEAA